VLFHGIGCTPMSAGRVRRGRASCPTEPERRGGHRPGLDASAAWRSPWSSASALRPDRSSTVPRGHRVLLPVGASRHHSVGSSADKTSAVGADHSLASVHATATRNRQATLGIAMALGRMTLLACAGASVHRTVPTERARGCSWGGRVGRLARHPANRLPGRRGAGGRLSRPLAISSLSHRPHCRFLAHRAFTWRTLGVHADMFRQARARQ
jgi:hypothetical protein